MPKDKWPEGANVINIAIVVAINKIRAFTTFEEQRIAADAFECPYRGIHATGYKLKRQLVQLS